MDRQEVTIGIRGEAKHFGRRRPKPPRLSPFTRKRSYFDFEREKMKTWIQVKLTPRRLDNMGLIMIGEPSYPFRP